ncbi:efflux RND transporter periplasmic adaptor subunit [Mangrovimicrobium sediminis]|uniref:Efflux RND transporter periplasmic adaptor subunit n=1 Tax=Mangrovimicrobium sediminis TaxID=2562682 RepID=A0A4Z0LW98_9GAMM|nr:efflux RND transporter periplasmic adaptor subunit [Haliea sp. SAOS-164]TGD71520.1 efflux RND transporter periplasmic adaptor subunit [Haliea sp. SAOS-164]
MNANGKILLALVAGVLLGAGGVWLSSGSGGDLAADNAERKPLYWVAPMDANYRRDKPGKSPMGMDLVPVYAEDAAQESAGTVRISPDVVNNLGVRTAKVSTGRLRASLDTVGYVQYDEDLLIHIHPRVAGWIEVLNVKAAGDPVAKGAPLYTLYSPTLVNAQEELLLALKRNNPVLVEAAEDRLAALQVPPEVIGRLRKTGRVERAITLYAPRDGVVDNLAAREGMYVEPGMKIMSIGTLDHVWVIGELFERQAAQVQVGDAVTMRLDYLPGRDWRGSVDYIYPTLNPRTRTARVRVRFDNPDEFLRPGMFAQMSIATQQDAETLLVPREALVRTGTQSRVVLAREGGRFKSVAVEVGRIGAEQAQVLSGLEAGDRIVTSAQFLIDSESSKTSDFRRMGANGDAAAMDMEHDHGQMDHGGIDHAETDHAEMDHAETDHAEMDHAAMNPAGRDPMNHTGHADMQHDAAPAGEDAP